MKKRNKLIKKVLTKGLKMCYYIVTTKGDGKECDGWQSIILKSVLIKKKLNKRRDIL